MTVKRVWGEVRVFTQLCEYTESEKVKVKSLSHVRLLATPWTAAHQAPSMGFSRQEYWSGVPLPSLNEIPRRVKFIKDRMLNGGCQGSQRRREEEIIV